jgi:hypothetical protein
MKKAQLYLIGNDIFFVPTVSKGRMISKMIEPIFSISIDDSLDSIGKQFILTLEHSRIGEVTIGNDVFKYFLKITKVMSNLQLVKKAQYIKVDCDDIKCTLLKVGGNLKHKAFTEDLGITPIEIDIINKNTEEIGGIIKALFLK